MAIKHHAKRFRCLHTRYMLIMLNGLVITGLLTYGITVRAAQAATQAVEDDMSKNFMMDSDTSQSYGMLMPPAVLGSR